MTGCELARNQFLDLLREGLNPGEGSRVAEHLRVCNECARDLRALRESWETLPEPADVAPPREVRDRVFARAREAARAPTGLPAALLLSMREEAAPIVLGMGAAALVLAALALRGAVAPVASGILVGKGLFLGAVLALVAAGILDRRTPASVRSVLVGGVGALGGYLALTLLSPIPGSVEYCRVALLGDPSLTVHQLCLVYLGVAALYAGVPMTAAAYAWPGRIDGPRAGLLAAGVFVVLAAPTLVLQVGVQEWFLAATLVVGAAVGSLAGGAGGGWFRTRRQVAGG